MLILHSLSSNNNILLHLSFANFYCFEFVFVRKGCKIPTNHWPSQSVAKTHNGVTQARLLERIFGWGQKRTYLFVCFFGTRGKRNFNEKNTFLTVTVRDSCALLEIRSKTE